jgi:thioredoxin-like negative regulator of GroEL
MNDNIEQVGDDYLEAKVLQENSEAHVVYVTSQDDPAVFVGEVLREIAVRNRNFKLVQVDAYAVTFAETYQVLSIPTTFIFKRGKLVTTLGGFVPAELIEEVIEKETRPKSVDMLLDELKHQREATEG